MSNYPDEVLVKSWCMDALMEGITKPAELTAYLVKKACDWGRAQSAAPATREEAK